jgi:hypothetical protein
MSRLYGPVHRSLQCRNSLHIQRAAQRVVLGLARDGLQQRIVVIDARDALNAQPVCLSKLTNSMPTWGLPSRLPIE